jgi:hypothetical protein
LTHFHLSIIMKKYLFLTLILCYSGLQAMDPFFKDIYTRKNLDDLGLNFEYYTNNNSGDGGGVDRGASTIDNDKSETDTNPRPKKQIRRTASAVNTHSNQASAAKSDKDLK